MNNIYGWRLPTKEELKTIRRTENRRFFKRTKYFFIISFLAIGLIYLITFASLSSKGGSKTENIYTLLILTIVLFFIIIVFLVLYKKLYQHFYGKKKNIEEVNTNTKFLYHQMAGGINDTEKLYTVVVRVDDSQVEILVDKKEYEKINEDTKIFIGRYKDEEKYNYYIYY